MREGRRLRPLALAVTVVGVVITLIALAQLAWVHLDDVRGTSDHSSWVIVFDDPAGRHGGGIWVLFVACAASALAAGWTAALWSQLLRCIGPLLAGALAVVALWQVFITDLVGEAPEFELWVDVELATGFWVTLLGLVLIALGAAFGATRPARGPSS